jgi:phosphoribosylglycinamide formyltransferase-1
MTKLKVAVLIGRGGRLKALYENLEKSHSACIVAVVSHKDESPGIEWARDMNIPAFYFRWSDFKKENPDRRAFDAELAKKLKEYNPDLIVMAGWDLIIHNELINEFPMKVINIHPALCPAFPGIEAEKQAIDYGVKYTGCTVHFVPDEGVDTGPIILQEIVKIEDSDTPETLSEKIHEKEDQILFEAVKLIAQNKIKVDGRKVLITE